MLQGDAAEWVGVDAPALSFLDVFISSHADTISRDFQSATHNLWCVPLGLARIEAQSRTSIVTRGASGAKMTMNDLQKAKTRYLCRSATECDVQLQHLENVVGTLHLVESDVVVSSPATAPRSWLHHATGLAAIPGAHPIRARRRALARRIAPADRCA